MIASFNEISTPMLVGGGIAVLVLNTLFMKWFLGKIQSEPLDEPEPDEVQEDEEALVSEPVLRTSAGVPRSRPLQPVELPPPGAEAANPIRLTTLSEASAAPAPSVPPAAAADPVSPYAPKPSAPAAEPAPAPAVKMTLPVIAPAGSLTSLSPAEPIKAEMPKLGIPKVDEPAAPSLSPLFAASEKPPETSPIPPPLNFTKRASISERPVLEQGRAASADLIMTPSAPPETAGQVPKPAAPQPAAGNIPVPLSSPLAPPAADLIFVDKPTPPLSSMSPRPAEVSTPSAKDMPPSKDLESSKPAGADLIAISPAAPSDKPPAEPKAPEILKPAATESASAQVGGGLMLIPSSPEASPVTPEPEKSAAEPIGGGQSSWKTRLLGRPRIFLPTGAAPAPEPAAAKEEAAETVSEGSLKERFAELKSEITPANPEDYAPIAKAEVPPVADKPAAEEAPAILTPVGDGKPGAKLGEIAESESLLPSKPEGPVEPAVETPKPTADLAPAPEVAPAAKPAEPKAPAPAAEVPATPKVSAATPAASVKVDAPSAQAAAAPNLPAPIRPAEPVMNQKESTAAVLPSGGRASAQITLGFEITSLQLTPFFKLGAVQLRSLSNIVSLHLIASQAAENPLAAGISFQIETVDLDASSHIKSILLKPLGQSTPTATPQPKLQVENVKLGTGNEGAIEITSSQQTSTAVQMLATFTIAAMDFTPSFEIGSLRLEPNSNTVMLRLAPSSKPTALDLPPSFEVATVSLEGSAQLATVRLVPTGAK